MDVKYLENGEKLYFRQQQAARLDQLSVHTSQGPSTVVPIYELKVPKKVRPSECTILVYTI